MEILVISLAVACNVLSVVWKMRHNRVEDGVLDVVVFIAISSLFTGTISGMTVAVVVSAVISIYSLLFPPRFLV